MSSTFDSWQRKVDYDTCLVNKLTIYDQINLLQIYTIIWMKMTFKFMYLTRFCCITLWEQNNILYAIIQS